MSDKNSVVLGIDIGSTNIKCFAYDQSANVLGHNEEKITTLNDSTNCAEIEPQTMWNSFQKVVKGCLLASHLDASDVLCLGISTQRGTFITWDKESGETFHNFISWKDRRAEKTCDRWNSSIFVKFLKFGSLLMYIFTRITKFQVLSALKFTPVMVLTRLCWILENNLEVRNRCVENRVLFGTIDTWLVWKLTGGKCHVTDASNACITGFFDPFQMQWANWILNIFKIPLNILPEVKKTCDSFGSTEPDIFGAAIPICCLVGDQQASMFGACCFEKFDLNCTIGTGSFINVNTGSSPSISYPGVFPLVGWTINSETTYIAESGIHDCGTVVSWAQNLGLFEQPKDSCCIAQSMSDNDGVYFLPPLFGIPEIACSSTSAFLGLKLNTSKGHMVRSVLEALAFEVSLLFDTISSVIKGKSSKFSVCGGISKNDFVVQLISNITSRELRRLRHHETSSLGAAFFAGLHHGIWKSKNDLLLLQTEFDNISPDSTQENCTKCFLKWKKIYKILKIPDM